MWYNILNCICMGGSRMKQFFKKSVLFGAVVFMLFFAPTIMCASQVNKPDFGGVTLDTEGPRIDFSTFKFEKDEVPYNGQNGLSFKVQDTSEVGSVTVWFTVGPKAVVTGSTMLYQEETGMWQNPITSSIAGTVELYYIDLIDAYGNKTIYINKGNSHFGNTENGLYWGDEDSIGVDLSEWSYTILGGNADDADGPTIDFNTFEVEKENVEFNEPNNFSFKVLDESEVGRVTLWVTIGDKAVVNGVTMLHREETGMWEGDITSVTSGEVEVSYINLVDANGNETTYVNKNNSHVNSMENGIYVDLSDWNYTVLGGNAEDVDGPIIDFKTFDIEKDEVKFKEENKISFKAYDESKIGRVTIWMTIGDKATVTGATMLYNQETLLWETAIIPTIFGKAEIYYIDLVDENGNTTYYYNEKNSHFGNTETGLYWGDETSTYEDLSDLCFYVGIQDDETGIFVSGSDITEDTTLEVEIKEHKGDVYDKMKGDKHKSHGYFEIRVKGHHKGGHKFKVFFDVPWAKDGEFVRICHMKHDGTMQIEEVPAKGGKVYMEVSEFSPFLIEEKIVDDNLAGNNSEESNASANTNGESSKKQENKDVNQTDKTAPDTGDDTFGFVYVAIFFLGVAIIVNEVLLKRKVR